MSSTKHKMYVPTHPGRLGNRRICDMYVPDDDILGAFMPANIVALLLKGEATGWYGPFGPSSNRWTQTLTGTGAAVANGTGEGGGILVTCGSSSTFNTNQESKQTFPITTDRHYGAAFRFQVSAITGIGFRIGFGNSQVLPFTTEYTDFVGFSKPIASANMVGAVIGNGGSIANSATLATMVNATEIMCGFKFVASSTTAYNMGFFWTLISGTLTKTNMTAAQLTALQAILTTEPSMYANWNCTGVTGTNPTMTSPMGVFYMENAY